MFARKDRRTLDLAIPDGYETQQIRVVPKPPPKGLKQKLEGILAELRQRKTLMMFCVHVAGGHTQVGAILHHFIEISSWGTNREGFVYKVDSELQEEIGVSSGMMRKFREALCYQLDEGKPKGTKFICIELKKANNIKQYHYCVNVGRLARALSRYTSQKFEPLYAVLLGEVSTLTEYTLSKSQGGVTKTARPITETKAEEKTEIKEGTESGTNTDKGFASLVCLSDSVVKLLEARGLILSSAVKAWTTTYGLSIEQITDDVVNEALVDSQAKGKVLIGVIANKVAEKEKSSAQKENDVDTWGDFCTCGAYSGGGLCAECDAEVDENEADNDAYTIETAQWSDGTWRWTVYDADYNCIKSGEGCTSKFHAQIRAENFMSEEVTL